MERSTNDKRILHGSSRSTVKGPRQGSQRMVSGDKSASASSLLKDTQTSTTTSGEESKKFSKCGKCKTTCNLATDSSTFKSSVSQRKYKLRHSLNCRSKFVIYLITCDKCGVQYVGKTTQELKARTGQHVGKCDTLNTHLAKHFRKDEHNISIIAIDQVNLDDYEDKGQAEKKLGDREMYWMKELKTIYPFGLNERVTGVGDISKQLNKVNVEGLSQHRKRRKRSHGHRKNTRPQKDLNLDELMSLYKENDSLSVHRLRSATYGLPKGTARRLHNEVLALVYSRTKKYPKQVLLIIKDILDRKLYPPKPDVNQEKKRRFLPILFHNKGMELINLPNILHNKTVSEKIPDYFVNKDAPSLCYKYTKTIASKVFNHKQVCKEFDNSKGTATYPCECNLNSRFIHPQLGHVVTGDLSLVKNNQLRDIMKKGPKFREQNHINWKTNRKIILEAINSFILKWAKQESVDVSCLHEYRDKILHLVDSRISRLKRNVKTYRPKILSKPAVARELASLHEKYVLAPADKAANNIIICCKRWYMEKNVTELDVYNTSSDDAAYKVVLDKAPEDLVVEQEDFCKQIDLPSIGTRDLPCQLPTFYGLPKMHKAIPKLRFIAASCQSPLKPLDITITRCLDAILKFMFRYCKAIYNRTGTNRMWIIEKSSQFKDTLEEVNDTQHAECISTWDFSTLYTTIPHLLLKDRMSDLIDFAFETNKKKFLAVNNIRAFWSSKEEKRYKNVTAQDLKDFLGYLVDNIYVTLGNSLHKQVIGIPMGISCAPLLANLFLMTYEYDFMKKMEKENLLLARTFNFTARFIDDLANGNNPDFGKYVSEIYPKELQIKKENADDKSASYLELQVTVKDNKYEFSLFAKTDGFDFEIVNYPWVNSSNIPSGPAYGVYSSRIITFARACDHFKDFRERHDSLCFKLYQQGFKYQKLCRQLSKTRKKHKELFGKYGERLEVPLPVMANTNKHVTLRS